MYQIRRWPSLPVGSGHRKDMRGSLECLLQAVGLVHICFCEFNVQLW